MQNLLEKQKKLLFGRQMFDVEIITDCNKNCYICPRNKFHRFGKTMSMQTFDTLCAWFPADCDVFFAGFGEPLLHKHCVDFVRRLHDSGRGTSIMTNGTLLSAEKLAQLFEAGLDKLQISILHKYDLPLIPHFMKMVSPDFKKRVVFNIIKEQSETLSAEYVNDLKKNGLNFCVKKVHNRAGLLFKSDTAPSLKTCATFFCDTYISADGEIQVCSSDINGTNNIGSIFKMSFDDLLAHKQQFFGNKQICSICSQCTDEYRLKHFTEN